MRVLLVEDYELIAIAVEHALRALPGIELVGTAGNGLEALAMSARLLPDVVLMDIAMPAMDGIEATRRLTAEQPSIRTLVFSASAESRQVIEAISAGAVGYLLKDTPAPVLCRAVLDVAKGLSPLAPEVATAVLDALKQRRSAVELTAREREVLALLGQGLSNKHIAIQLAISEKTVKVHLSRMFQRLGVRDRTAAAVWAERNGLFAAGV